MSEERVSRSASFAFMTQMIGAAFTAVLTVFLGRKLGANQGEQFGEFTFALSVMTIAALLVDFGITSSSGRYMAERRADGDAAGAVFRTALRLKLRIGLVATVALLALSGPICDAFGQSGAVWPLRGCALALLAQSLLGLVLSSFIALGRIRYNLVLATVESVAETTASIALVLLGAAATGAAFGRAIGYGVGLAAGLVVASRMIGQLRSRSVARDHAVLAPRQILSYARPLLVVDAAFRAFASVDVLLIAAILGGSAQIAAFGLPMRLAAFLDYPAAAVASAVSPRLARDGSGHEDVTLLAQSMRYLTILQMLFTAPALIWPEAILHLIFGSKYPAAPAVLRALAPYVFLSGIAQLTTLAVNFLGEARRRVPIAIAMLALNVAIDVILLPRIGVVAGAIGTSAAYALWVPAHVWILRQRAGLALAPLLVTTLRACLAGAAMVGVLALLGTGVVALPLMLAGALAGPLVYVAALFALRELTLDDVATVRGVVARRVAA